MPLNIRDAESSFLYARSRVEEWKQDFISQWLAPQREILTVMFWQSLDPAVKQELQARNPQAYSQVDQEVKAILERYKNGPSR